MPITDEEAALQAISALDPLSKEQKTAIDQVKFLRSGGDGNPHADIHELFRLFNTIYFRKLLLPRVEVSWSSRLTLCAGICELVKDEEGKYRRIRLKLSEALLKYRPQSDTINTLLHEAIHAYFFVTTSWRHSRGDDGTGHGNGFLLLADAINNHGNYLVTVYHTFHDEVDSYRTHIWQCDGPCRNRAPLFGLVKRSMNRAPSKADTWWKQHEETCGGRYTKIAEPELTKKQLESMSAMERAGRQKTKIDAWMKGSIANHTQENANQSVVKDDNNIEPSNNSLGTKRRHPTDEGSDSRSKVIVVNCPICDLQMVDSDINAHLDAQHPP